MSELHVTAEPGLPFIDTEREVAAPRDLVFRCYAEPELVLRWLGPRELEMRIDTWDARTGGHYRYVHVAPDGSEFGFHGSFHGGFAPDQQMVQTFEFDGYPGHVALDSTTLEERDGRTLIRTHSVYQSVADRDGMVASGMADGMRQGYERMQELLASLATTAG